MSRFKVRFSKPRKRFPFSRCVSGLDLSAVQEILNGEDLPEPEASPERRGLAVGETTVGLLSVCDRLLDLLDTPEDIPFLSPLIQREIAYRLLRSPQGECLRAIATRGDLSNRTARAIAWLRSNYTKPLHMEELAAWPVWAFPRCTTSSVH